MNTRCANSGMLTNHRFANHDLFVLCCCRGDNTPGENINIPCGNLSLAGVDFSTHVQSDVNHIVGKSPPEKSKEEELST